MDKYLTIFKVSFAQEFAYRMNFIMWRVRNVLQIFLVFFLWDSVFSNPNTQIFGYSRGEILTYVFMLLIVRSIVMATRSIDVAGEISRGDISNYLVKPVSHIGYWFTRDISSKALNLSFAVVEVGLLWAILRPPLIFQTNPILILFFAVSLLLSVFIYFLFMYILNLLPFWYPEQSWGVIFLLFIFVDFLGGGVFPLDVLPKFWQGIVNLTPFPYLMFFPIQTYLGKLTTTKVLGNFAIEIVWIGLLLFIAGKVWKAGIKRYEAEGK